MNVTWKKLSLENWHKDLLKGYKRYTKTTRVKYLKDGLLCEKEDVFEEDWDNKKLQTIADYLRICVLRGGAVIIGIAQNKVIAFGNVEPKLYYNTYIHMPYVHVSKDFRHQHLGHQLFTLLEEEARNLGGKKLYISTHPSIETQAYYTKMGCVLATTIIPELYELEPYDIQLEKPLYRSSLWTT